MTSPRILLRATSIRPSKKLGQNFLTDPSAAQKIVDRSGIGPGDAVLEIGAGLGALTIPAARTAKTVYAVEKDRRMAELLKTELLAKGLSNVVLLETDILKLDIKALAKDAGRPFLVLGNLPYNISSQVLVKLLHARAYANRAVLMFQKELARRITANPGSKDYGRLTVMLRYCSEIAAVMELGASQFYPKPAVDSEVLEIRFKARPDHPADNEAFLFKVVKAAFGQRRKTLRNALSGSEFRIEPNVARDALENAGINPSRRAETLTVEEFVRLEKGLAEIIPDAR